MTDETQGQLRACLAYFRRCPVWHRLLAGFREKYYSYGRLAGTVRLNQLSAGEIEELEGFFGKSFHGLEGVSISASGFAKALKNSRYGEVSPERLLAAFFQQPLEGKQEQLAFRERQKQQILQKLQQEYTGTPAEEYLSLLTDLLSDKEKTDLSEQERLLRLSAEMVNHLPWRQNRKVYLAVFAACLTGNPHAFDAGTREGGLLYRVIQKDLEKRRVVIEKSELFPAYQRQRSFLAAGILVDDISNYALLYQVQAIRKDGSLHEGMRGFYQEEDMVQVPLAVLDGWQEIRCCQQEIFIVENPSVFAVLCGNHPSDQKRSRRSCMCMNGQPRLAGLMVLDRLSRSGTRVYYSGDLDPEGLLIAQKLSRYYRGEFRFWHMTEEDYETSRSNETISPRRMKILEQITDPQLLPVVQKIREFQTAGYQERIFANGHNYPSSFL